MICISFLFSQVSVYRARTVNLLTTNARGNASAEMVILFLAAEYEKNLPR